MFISNTKHQENEKRHTPQLAHFLAGIDTQIQPEDIVQSAIGESLGPMFLYRLKEASIVLDNEQKFGALSTDVKAWKVISLLQEQAMLEVNQALSQAGIRCVWLKGAVLGRLIYPEVYLRPKFDLDCIVYENDFSRALDILLNMNYVHADGGLKIRTVAHERLEHHVELKHTHHRHVQLELHRHLLGMAGTTLIPLDKLGQWLDQAVTIEVANQTVYTLRPEHHFLYLCAHTFLQHGETHLGLLQLLDMYFFLTTFKLDWDVLTEEAKELNWTFLADYSLRRIQEIFDIPIDSHVFQLLRANGVEDQSASYMLLKRHQIFQSEYEFSFMSQLSLHDQITTILQLVFPPERFMRIRYLIPPERHVLPYYGYRLVILMIAMIRRVFIQLGTPFS